jgi:lysozyme
MVNDMMQVGKTGLAFLKEREGLRLQAYDDATGKPLARGDKVIGTVTIGYGHTAPDLYAGMKISQAEAERLLLADVEKAAAAVRRHVYVGLSQSQFDALVSFVYNVGVSAFAKSTLVELLNQGQFEAVPRQLSRWDKETVLTTDPATGKAKRVKRQNPGLVKRRALEIALWAADEYEPDKPSAVPVPLPPKKPSNSRTIWGGVVTILSGLGLFVKDLADTLEPVAQYREELLLAFIGLTIVGGVLTITGRLRVMREDGV